MVCFIVRSAGSCVLPVAGPRRRFGGPRLHAVAAAPPPQATTAQACSPAAASTPAPAPSTAFFVPGSCFPRARRHGLSRLLGVHHPVRVRPVMRRRRKTPSSSESSRWSSWQPNFSPQSPVTCMELPGLHDQVVFGDLAAERSFALWVEVANRLRPPTDTKLHQGLHLCGEVFVAAKVRKGAIPWKRARDLAEGLELLRRIVSSALHAPLPLTWTWYAVVPMEYDSKAGFSLLLQQSCRIVEDDIHSMFDDERTTN